MPIIEEVEEKCPVCGSLNTYLEDGILKCHGCEGGAKSRINPIRPDWMWEDWAVEIVRLTNQPSWEELIEKFENVRSYIEYLESLLPDCDFCAGTGEALIDHDGKKLYDGRFGPCPDCKGTGKINP